VVRRSREVEYRRLYLGFRDDAPADAPLVPTFDYILTSPPFIDVSDSEGPTTAQLTTARNHRGGLTGHLVGWHQAEYSSCATTTRSRFYLPTPAWWSGVEVPYGYMAELPWVHAYATDDLQAGRRTPWAIFRSEWALEAAVVLLETFRNLQVLWRYPPRLLDWIRALGPANICVGPRDPDAEATAILGALLDLADQLPDTEAFRERLRARNTDRRDREGWVWAGLEMENHAACAKVAEDLRPFDLPYTADILAARSYGDTRGGWAAAVSTARSPRYPGGGTEPPASSAVTGRGIFPGGSVVVRPGYRSLRGQLLGQPHRFIRPRGTPGHPRCRLRPAGPRPLGSGTAGVGACRRMRPRRASRLHDGDLDGRLVPHRRLPRGLGRAVGPGQRRHPAPAGEGAASVGGSS